MRLGAATVSIAALAMPTASPGETLPLPAEIELEAENLRFIVDDATLHLRFDPEIAVGWLRLAALAPDRPVPSVDVTRDADGLTVDRSLQAAPGTLLVEATLARGRRIAIEGAELDVTIEEIAENEDIEAAVPPRAARSPGRTGQPPAVDLRVVDSRLELNRLHGVSIVIDGGSARLLATSGALDIEATGASTTLEDHRGAVSLTAIGGDSAITHQTGELRLGLTDSDLEVFGGDGPVAGQLEGGFIRLEERQGKVEISGNSSTVELLRLPGQIALQGEQLAARVDTLSGPFNATLVSGQLEGGNLSGAVQLELSDGARVGLERLTAGALLKSAQSDARLRSVAPLLKSDVRGGVLDVAEVEGLEVVAVDATVTASDVRKVRTIDLRDSQFELYLETLTNNPRLQLKGFSDGVVSLMTPCYVRLSDPQGLAATRMRVTGCELEAPAQWRRRLTTTRLDGSRVTRMTVELAADATVEISGNP